MPRFFDVKTKTIFVTKGQTAQENLSTNPLLEIPAPDEMPGPVKLRREFAGEATKFAGISRPYLSLTTGSIYSGKFDLHDKSNEDLVKCSEITEIHCP
jgi:hypothetical protein